MIIVIICYVFRFGIVVKTLKMLFVVSFIVFFILNGE